MKPQKKSKESTSQYRGVYFNAKDKKWVVYLEKHENHPHFYVEYDAGIYAEYYLRQLYGITPNFPQLDDDDLERRFSSVMSIFEIEIAKKRSSGLQGVKKRGDATSKYVGVSQKRGTKWMANIQYRGKVIRLGSFNKTAPKAEEQAAMAYDRKALELYGEKAKLNFPDLIDQYKQEIQPPQE